MTLAALWPYFRGYVIMTVKGRTLERFVNVALARGIDLWGIARVDDRSLVARAYLRDLPSLGRILRETGCRGRIEEKVGAPFVLRRLARRKSLVAAAVLFSVALYTLSSFVWFVDVSGVEKTEPETVLEMAKKYGLHPGAPKRRLDPGKVAKGILADLPSLTWAAVHVRGTMASIEVVEKTLPDVSAGAVDVVAAEDALVTNVIVLSGEPLVAEGDTVTKGQVLIAGFVRIGGGPSSGAGDFETVNARGIVMGRVWRTHREQCRLVRETAAETGRVVRARRFTVGSLSLTLGPKSSPFVDYEEAASSYRIPLGGDPRWFVEVDVTEYREVVRKTEVLNREEVLAGARARARSALEASLPSDAKVLDVTEDVRYAQGGTVVLTLTIETSEDIAVERRQERGVEHPDRS